MRKRTLLLLLVIVLSVGATSCGPGASLAPTPTPTQTPTSTPLPTPTPMPTLTPTLAPERVEISVYFTDSDNYVEGTPPFERPVTRFVDPSSNRPEAVLRAFFEGPTTEEQEQGLELIASGFTGFESLVIEDGVARVYLTGHCRTAGGVYTVAQPIMRNLLQFPGVEAVKIYDESGTTQDPDGTSNSIPFCLEP